MKPPKSRNGSIDSTPYVAKDGTKSWRIRWYDHTGVRKAEWVAGTKALARRRLNTRLREVAEIIDGLRAAPRPDAPTLEAIAVRAAVEFLPHRQRRRQQLETLRRLRGWFGGLLSKPINKITAADIRGVLAVKRAEGRKPATCNRALSAISVMFQAAIEWDHMTDNPAQSKGLRLKEGKKAPRFLTPREARQVIEASVGQWRPFFATAIFAGLRLSELAALRWSDVDLEQQRIVVRHSVDDDDPKSGHHRVLPMHDELRQHLLEHGERPGDHLVFPGRARRPGRADPTGDQLSGGAAYRALARSLKAAQISETYGPHDLRHTFATLCIFAGVNLRELQGFMGHASLTTTARYVHSLGLTETSINRLQLPELEEES